MAANNGFLPVPMAAESEETSIEVLRVWSVKRKNHCAFNTTELSDPAAWGMLLADVTRQVSRAFEQAGLMDREVARKRIREAMEAELQRLHQSREGQTKQHPKEHHSRESTH